MCVFYFILLNLNSLVVFIGGGGERMPGELGATSSNSFPKVSLKKKKKKKRLKSVYELI